MQTYSLTHLSDPSLLRGLDALDSQDRTTSAAQLAHVAEVDSRKLYLPAGYPSMFAYCVGERGYSDDVAAKRIQAARVARRFPAIFPALADGRLPLTAVNLLAPHLTEDTAEELLAAAAHQTKSEIERLLAARFPVSDLLAWVETMPGPPAARCVGEHAPAHTEAQQAARPVDRSRVKPLSHESFGVQFTLGQRAHAKLGYIQELLSHEIPSGDLAEVFEALCDLAIPQLEKRKFAATGKPRHGHRTPAADSRHIPDAVQRACASRRLRRLERGPRRSRRTSWRSSPTFGSWDTTPGKPAMRRDCAATWPTPRSKRACASHSRTSA